MADRGSEVHPDLQKERQKATFSSYLLTNFLDGSEEKTKRRRYIEKLAIDDPELQHKPTCFLTRPEALDLQLKKASRMVLMIHEHDLFDPYEKAMFKRVVSPHESQPFNLHDLMFLPTLLNQGTQEQQEKWMEKAMTYEIVCTYAQTEMGHGTFLRGLETTATYDPETEEFVLEMPTLTATKWWPGNLGKTTNHALVLAQLYTQGKCHGLHAFVVQIRDFKTWQPLPGVTVGDIGPKLGYASMDNGFLRLDKVRVPRDHMLMKHGQLHKDGTYVTKSKNSKLTYGTMLLVRAVITRFMSQCLAEAATIAIRYSAIRKQSEIKPGTEAFILDYQTQQYNLFPVLATAYAFRFTGVHVVDMFFKIQDDINLGNLESLPELHAVSAAAKAFTSWVGSSMIETCRLSCGGHGYSHASGLPKIYADATPACTYEGENTVMMLQTARLLKKYHMRATNGEHIPGFMAYLSAPRTTRSSIDKNLRLEDLLALYKHRAHACVDEAMARFATVCKTHSEFDAWNLSSVLLVKAATVHCHYFIVYNFVDVLPTLEDSLKPVLSALCRLYAVHGILENSGDFIKNGYLTPSQLAMLQNAMYDLLGEIRPNAVALVDAFDIPDRILDSVLGCYDGQVYEKLYKWAQQSTLNQEEVPPGIFKFMKPMVEELKAKL
ncbi:peroxisomal acyl-coenzyme A oxidase 1-like [Lineus longissimus]|uniref:peroxisomal acyl-coenzyme A oxidase 1-like n=1 Tax=Lineus longissimus TaxID=88925 RepID=UPI002B4C639A